MNTAELPEQLIAQAKPALETDLVFKRVNSRPGVVYYAPRPTRLTFAGRAAARHLEAIPPAMKPSQQQEEKMSTGAPTEQIHREIRHWRRHQMRGAQDARTGAVEVEAVNDVSLKSLTKRFLPVLVIIVIAGFITQMVGIPTALALGLLIAQAILVVFGILVWMHKHRT